MPCISKKEKEKEKQRRKEGKEKKEVRRKKQRRGAYGDGAEFANLTLGSPEKF